MASAKRVGKPPRKRLDACGEPSVTGAVPYRPKMSHAMACASIDESLGDLIELATFRPTVTPLTAVERGVLVDQARLMLEQLYVHLPLKRAMHAIEPIQRLRLLALHYLNPDMDEQAFQHEMISIFISLRDLHTNYILPSAYTQKFAFLPFRVEEFYDAHVRKYVVSWVSPVSKVKQLTAGGVVTHWNGSPIELAVARHADREAGSNLEARRARGVEALTLRWLGMSLPPDEDWVDLTYQDGGKTLESRFDWQVIDAADRAELLAGLANIAGTAEAAAAWGLDLKTHLLHKIRKVVFDPSVVQLEREMAKYRAGPAAATLAAGAPLSPPRADTSLFPEVFPRFGPVQTPSGTFGYVRLRTFAPLTGDFNGAVLELVRILGTLPAAGLILDVRGNGGGYINFGERCLQLFTPRPITPEPFHFLTTGVTLGIADNPWLTTWREAIAQGLETGGSFSQGFPLTAPEACNDIGQVYQGPVVLIIDAICYSTTDIFAAGFQDHQIGTILGTHHNTGAGGANVWGYDDVLQQLAFPTPNPFVPLPQGARMRVAARRSTRVGARSGVPLEEVGVVPEEYYELTRSDVLDHNEDLIAHAAKILAGKEKQTLRLARQTGTAAPQIQIDATNLDRVDLLLEGRPIASLDVGGTALTVPLPVTIASGRILTGNGYRGTDLVVSSRLRL